MIKKIILAIWSLVISVVFLSSLETQLIVNKSLKRQVNTIFPEGWGFFTKSPREDKLDVFKLSDDNVWKPLTIKNQSFSNFFGFSRKARYIAYESSIVASQLANSNWMKLTNGQIFTTKIDTCFNLKSNKEHKYFTSGTYLLILQKPIPFVWIKENQEQYNPVKVAKLCLE